MLLFDCSGCGKKLRVAATLAGKVVKCPACGKGTAVPAAPVRAAVEASLSGTEHGALPPLVAALPPPGRLDPTRGKPGDSGPTLASQAEAVSQPTLAEMAKRQTPPNAGKRWDFLGPPEAPDELGRLGAYRILRVLGVGGMGVVFYAEDLRLRRPTALKVMLPHVAENLPGASQRFQREAMSTAQIEHDHIVTIYHVGEDRGVPYIAMRMLRGESLEKRLKRDGKLPLVETLRIAREIAEGLAVAHAHGLVHRDIKPSNIWLEEGKGRVKLLDFGLALGGDDLNLTQTGAIVGTPAYMAPEQAAASHDVDHRCDLFSLGCVLYRMSTGTTPFAGAGTMSVLLALELHNPEPPAQRDPQLPPAFSGLIMQLLAKKPDRRPKSAQEVVDRIEWLETQVPRQPAPAMLPPVAESPPPKAIPLGSMDQTSIDAARPGAALLPNLSITAMPTIPRADGADLPPLPPLPVTAVAAGPPPHPGNGPTASVFPARRPRLLLLAGAVVLVAAAIAAAVVLPGLLHTAEDPDHQNPLAQKHETDKKTETGKKTETDPGKKPTTDSGKKPTTGPAKPAPVKPKPLPDLTLDSAPRLLYQYDTLKNFGLDVAGTHKPLIFPNDGRANSTQLRIDKDKQVAFGNVVVGQLLFSQDAPDWPAPGKPLASARSKNIWQVINPQICVTQVVDLIPGRQPMEVKPGDWRWVKDTCLAALQVENKDALPHTVGLRLLLKVKVGDKVGMNFAGPGLAEPITDEGKLATDKVSLFLQDTEAADLHQPGTVAHLGLKPGGGLEAPSFVQITAWSNDQRAFDFPEKHMGVNPCVILYWPDKLLQPGEKRSLGFTWGLGRVGAPPQKTGTPQFGVSVDGAFAPGKEFTVFAQVRDWDAGFKLKLELEPGLTLVKGPAEQAAPQPLGSTTSLVSWTVRAEEVGHHEITVSSSSKLSQRQAVFITKSAPTKELTKQQLFE